MLSNPISAMLQSEMVATMPNPFGLRRAPHQFHKVLSITAWFFDGWDCLDHP